MPPRYLLRFLNFDLVIYLFFGEKIEAFSNFRPHSSLQNSITFFNTISNFLKIPANTLLQNSRLIEVRHISNTCLRYLQ